MLRSFDDYNKEALRLLNPLELPSLPESLTDKWFLIIFLATVSKDKRLATYAQSQLEQVRSLPECRVLH